MDGGRIRYSERTWKVADIDADLADGQLRVPAPVDLVRCSAFTEFDNDLSVLSDLMDSDRRCASDLFSEGKEQTDALVRRRKAGRLKDAEKI